MNNEVKDILDYSFKFAKDLLEATTQFYPFGAYCDGLEGVHPLEYDTEENGIPNNGKVVDSLTTYCASEFNEGRIKAYGLTYEVKMKLEEGQPETDAIAVEITHKDEESLPIFYLPYTQIDKTTTFGEPFAVAK